ncbi:MICOS complex subunit MIC27-like [Asterias rubens]|uniref:MICOS complex subunit MIC27-like n=1 Tax=Asterias rubens TaxID=7604 RepID=UPI0014553402|nr:MICOS complex subunit MIC27-like [Asterias rubens]
MAARQMRRILRVAALPVLGSAGLALGLPVVKADAVTNPGEAKRQGVLPRNLSIYDDAQVEYQINPVDTSGYLYQAVSIVRQNVWTVSDSVQGAVEKVKQAYKFAEQKEKDIVEFVKTEEGFYQRAGVITLAGLTGVVLARKGGMLRKIFYSGGLMTATASLCYPYQVVRITKAEYEALKTFWSDSVGSGVAERVKERMSGAIAKKQTEEPVMSNQEDTPTPGDDVTETAPSTDAVELQADHGMSNPEDKDMYTTRT